MTEPQTPASTDVIQRCIRPDVRAMHSYVVQPSQGMIKLDAMENPFTLPDALQHQLGERLARVALNRYPATDHINELRHALAQHDHLPAGFDLILGNGSDELISLLTLACAQPGTSVLAPSPSFVMYEVSAQLQSMPFIGAPLTPQFELDESAMLQAIEQHQPALIYLAYPNNPTANLFNDQAINNIIAAASGLVVIDEAYQPFASRNYLQRAAQHPNVVVMRTLSKFGLAGVRLGYLMGPQALIKEINKVRPPYNISVLNTQTALFALEHADEYDRQARVLRQERETLQQQLSALSSVQSFASEANMILVRVPNADACFNSLKRHKILVKNVSQSHPLLANCLRLTVGTPEENIALMNALKASL